MRRSYLLTTVLVAVIVLAVAAPPAMAATTVSGADDRTSPLVIQPSGEGSVSDGWDQLFFIQKMPVTKTVNRVTLGDIALAPECMAGPTEPILDLFVRQHPTGAIGKETNSLQWDGNALEQIPADHELKPRTWRTEPMTFVKGRGYSFWVQSERNFCTTYKVRSWPHNHSQVNPGDERCDRVLGGAFRMWHEAGATDAVPCPYDAIPGNFDPGMPEGWLTVSRYGASSYVDTREFYEQGSPPPEPECPYPLGEYGGEPVRWRDATWNPDWGEYVCVWNQRYPAWLPSSSPFYPNDPPDGWYFGFGWTTPAADFPRDMHLELDLDEDEFARWYKPNLYFDTDEKWRPLDINHFFDERDAAGGFLHVLCWMPSGQLACGPRGSPDELMEHNATDSVLKVNGLEAADDEDYQSPNLACRVDGLYDCNGGTISTLYDYVSRPVGDTEYRYIGYWAFYRYNKFSDLGDHEGDWEGVALAPSYARPGTFDFASLSSHGPWYSYLRDTLRCADAYFYPYTCGTEEDKFFSHVNAYVADGSHANYPLPCSDDCPRAGGLPPIENRYDGARGWGHNYNWAGAHPTGVRAFPPADGTTWVNWLGRWGWNGAPASPGQQAEFLDPWSDCGWGQECPMPPARARSRRDRRSRAPVPAAPARCGQWFGPVVAAVACNAPALRRSIESGSLGASRRIRLSVQRRPSVATRRAPIRTGSSVAVGQALGTPLRPGDALLVRGAGTGGITILVRVQSSEHVYNVRFAARRLRGVGRVVVRQGSNARPSVTLLRRDMSPLRPRSIRQMSRGGG